MYFCILIKVVALAGFLAFIFRKPDIEDETGDDDNSGHATVNEDNWEPENLESMHVFIIINLT